MGVFLLIFLGGYMGRPKNKEELLSLSQINFEKLFNMIEDLTLEEKQVEEKSP